MRDGLIGAMTRVRELRPRHLPPRAVQPARQPEREGHRRAALPSRCRPTTSGRRRSRPRRARCRAATSRRSSWRGSSPGPSGWSSPPSRHAASTSGPSSTSTGGSWSKRDAGAAVLIVSTELDEVLAVGDRVAVMLGGRIVGIVEGPEATREKRGHADEWCRMRRLGRALRPAVVPILAVVTAFIVGSIVILVTDFQNLGRLGTDPVGAITGPLGTIGAAYYAMLIGALGDPARIGAALADPTPRAIAAAIRPITETLVASTPLIFAGLAVAISFRSGVFNIGVEGQFVLGAFGATVAAHRAQGPADAAHPPGLDHRGCPDRGRVGLDPGLPEGPDRCPRGHHHDHAQLRGLPDRPVRPALGLPQEGGEPRADLEGPVRLRAHPAHHRPPGDPAALGLRRGAPHGRRPCRGSCSGPPRASSSAPRAST